METMKTGESFGAGYELPNFREDLAFIGLEIEKRLGLQRDRSEKAKRLDPVLRRLSKEVISRLNAGRAEEAEEKYKQLLYASAEMFAIRGLARQSFYRFRALKETMETAYYKQVRPYIFDGGEEPSLSALRNLDFIVEYTRKGVAEKRTKKIFSDEEMDVSFVEAMAEGVGEISKGLTFEMVMVDWQISPELQEKYLAVGRRALSVAMYTIQECENLASQYSEFFDKYFRFMIVRMTDSMEYIKDHINAVQAAIASRQK